MRNVIYEINNTSIAIKILLVILFILSIISVSQGFNNALIYSNDFQWSPSVLLSEGINPYEYYLNDYSKDRIIKSQAPNYAHATYVIIMPFAMLDWSIAPKMWAMFNIILTTLTLYILSKRSQINNVKALFIIFLYLCSTPFRNALGNGQQSILVLFAFCSILSSMRYAGILSGLGYLKYSFAPPLALYTLQKYKLRGLVLSLAIPIIGFVIFYLIQDNKNIFLLLAQPLQVNARSVGYGVADFMTLLSLLISNDSFLLSFVIPVLGSLFLTYFLTKKSHDRLYELSIISIISLLFFKHLIYDYVFLLPALFFCIKHLYLLYSKFTLLGITFFWFGYKVIYHLSINFNFLNEYFLYAKSFNFFVLMFILIFLVLSKVHSNYLN